MLATPLPQKKRSAKAVGTFAKMGLASALLRGIKGCRYRLPTPIQRKCIPLALEGHDLVAMARTGSGKTAAFLIPMIEALKEHSHTVGIRGLIVAPTRELTVQTQKFAAKLAKYTSLRICVIVGGEALDQQFDALSRNPDILISTPGRLCYLMKETGLSLRAVTMCVFDEADRLFEMGFAVQLRMILNRLSKERQTLLLSATMPGSLVDFTSANLRNPCVVRLDTDTKVSKNLQLSNVFIRKDEKLGALLLLLTNGWDPKQKMTLIFTATRYHCELIAYVLSEKCGIPCSLVYGMMDQTFRRENIEKFRKGLVKTMVVTDVAARGIDIPLLDFVINFHVPSDPKTFIHRVGRVARAGRLGSAWSLVSADELPYLADVSRFLGHQIPISDDYLSSDEDCEEREGGDSDVEMFDERRRNDEGESEFDSEQELDDYGQPKKSRSLKKKKKRKGKNKNRGKLDKNDPNFAFEERKQREKEIDYLNRKFDGRVEQINEEEQDVSEEEEMQSDHPFSSIKKSWMNADSFEVDSDEESHRELMSIIADSTQSSSQMNSGGKRRNNGIFLFGELSEQCSFGSIPQRILRPFTERVNADTKEDLEYINLSEQCKKAEKLYHKTKKRATSMGVRLSKRMDILSMHPVFEKESTQEQSEQESMLISLKGFRPPSTVFEMGGASNPDYQVMKMRRKHSQSMIDSKKDEIEQRKMKRSKQGKSTDNNGHSSMSLAAQLLSHSGKQSSGSMTATPRTIDSLKKAKTKKRKTSSSVFDLSQYQDKSHYLSGKMDPKSEVNRELMRVDGTDSNNRSNDLEKFILELDTEERQAINVHKKMHRFNKNTGKYVTEFMNDRVLRILGERNESGKMVKEGSHEYGRLYREWQKQSKRNIQAIGEEESSSLAPNMAVEHRSLKALGLRKWRHTRGSETDAARLRAKVKRAELKRQLKSKEQIKEWKIHRAKKEHFRKWWASNKDRIKQRKSQRRRRGY